MALNPSVVSLWDERILICSVDSAGSEVARLVCSRFDCQERRHALHAVPGSQSVSDLHERLHTGRFADAQEVG